MIGSTALSSLATPVAHQLGVLETDVLLERFWRNTAHDSDTEHIDDT